MYKKYPKFQFVPKPNLVYDNAKQIIKDAGPVGYIIQDMIIRKTYGWQKDHDKITISQFVDMTGFSEKTIKNALKKLVSAGWVVRHEVEKVSAKGVVYESTPYFSIAIDDEKYTQEPPVEIAPPVSTTPPGGQILPPPGGNDDPPQYTLTINTKTINNAQRANTIILYYNKLFSKNIKLTEQRKTKIMSTLKNYSLLELTRSLNILKKDNWSIKNNQLDIERIIDAKKRDRNIELFLAEYRKQLKPRREVKPETDDYADAFDAIAAKAKTDS